jgi:putative spermidine/putrescine transport system substrate-binding protein
MSRNAPSTNAGHAIRRRTVLGAALGGAAALGSRSRAARAAADQVTFVSYGGSYGESLEKYILAPFRQKTGIAVSLGVNSTLAGLKMQVASGQMEWDLVEVAGGEFVEGVAENLFEPLDFKIIDSRKVPAFAKSDFGIEYALFLSGIGYDAHAMKAADAPQTWPEVWDTKKWPGLRAFSKHIADSGTLEAALLAAGVPMEKLYPLDVERAIASLKTFGKQGIVWYENNQDPVNFLSQHEGPLSYIASGRVVLANAKGAQLGFVYNQMQLNGDYLVVPRGARNKEAAFRLIDFIVNDDKAGADWMQATSYAIANTGAVGLLPSAVADTLPTSPKMAGRFFQKDFAWWGAHYKPTTLRFQEFLATGA